MDILVPIPMKSAAKCDTQCELQNSANHQILERNWRWRDILSACLFQCLKTSKHHNVFDWLYARKSGQVYLTWKMYAWIFGGSIELVTDSSVISYGYISLRSNLKKTRIGFFQNHLSSASEIRQEHPLNLSILLSGGKEINEDCLSSGERSGKSSIRIGGLRSLNCNLKVKAKGEVEA